jgi:hypothetical protein
MLIANSILSAIALGLFIPMIQPSRKGVLDVARCEKYSLRLRVHAVLCTVVAALFAIKYGLSAPFAPLFIALTALSCFLCASHFHRILLSLKAGEREAS